MLKQKLKHLMIVQVRNTSRRPLQTQICSAWLAVEQIKTSKEQRAENTNYACSASPRHTWHTAFGSVKFKHLLLRPKQNSNNKKLVYVLQPHVDQLHVHAVLRSVISVRIGWFFNDSFSKWNKKRSPIIYLGVINFIKTTTNRCVRCCFGSVSLVGWGVEAYWSVWKS